MNPPFTDRFIQLVREANPIAEVASEHVSLAVADDGTLNGRCPVGPDSDETAAFYVTPERGMYYCFGCSEGGDVFSLVQNLKGLSYTEAVGFLARRGGVEAAEVAS